MMAEQINLTVAIAIAKLMMVKLKRYKKPGIVGAITLVVILSSFHESSILKEVNRGNQAGNIAIATSAKSSADSYVPDRIFPDTGSTSANFTLIHKSPDLKDINRGNQAGNIAIATSAAKSSEDSSVPDRIFPATDSTSTNSSSIHEPSDLKGTNRDNQAGDIAIATSAKSSADNSVPDRIFPATGSTSANSTLKTSIVVNLAGQLGNHLCLLAHAKGIQLQLKEDHGLEAEILLQKKDSLPKVRAELWKCFPETRSLAYASEEELGQRKEQQKTWLEIHGLSRVKTKVARMINKKLNHPYGMVGISSSPQQTNALNLFYENLVMYDGNTTSPIGLADAKISIPFLLTSNQATSHTMDKYYNEIRDFFHLSADCCAQVPDPDETVFHLRNFLSEVGERAYLSSGFEETSPNKTSNELLGHLNVGDKVAIVAKGTTEALRDYVPVLEKRGLQVRVVHQSGIQDFCFLKKAQKEIAGSAVSTYVRWAAFLGDAKRVQLYVLDGHGMRVDFKTKTNDCVSSMFENFSWTHPELKSRVQFKVIKSETIEEFYKNQTEVSSHPEEKIPQAGEGASFGNLNGEDYLRNEENNSMVPQTIQP